MLEEIMLRNKGTIVEVKHKQRESASLWASRIVIPMDSVIPFVPSFTWSSRHYQIMTQSSPCREEELLFKKRGQVLHVILNRPNVLNALNLSMVRNLTAKLKECVQDPRTSVITLRGAGEKAFCAGGDLKALTYSVQEGSNYGHDFFLEEFTLNYMIGTFPKPLVSIMNGITFGGAAGLTAVGRFNVATEKSVFCMPECAIGLFPDVGSGYFLSRLPDNLGMFLGLTGHRLRGREIVRAGLASHYVEYSKIPHLDSVLEALEPPVSMEDINALLNGFQDMSTTTVPERSTLEQHREQIAHCFSGNSVEEIVSNLEQDHSTWAQTQLCAIKKMSPTSLKITFRLLKEGLNKNLAETLKTEYRLTQRCVEDKDFHEGIRATILDKDHNPRWTPDKLKDVTVERVDYYFSPLSRGQELDLK